MKKPVVMAVTLLTLCLAGVFTGAEYPREYPDGMRLQARARQILDSNERIDPDLVGDAQLKELGETVLNRIIADPVMRSWINDTMGGRSSECLGDLYKMIGYRFLHDRSGLSESMNKDRFSAGHAMMRSRIRLEDSESGSHKIRLETLTGYLMFLFLFISALGSLIYMVRLLNGRM